MESSSINGFSLTEKLPSAEDLRLLGGTRPKRVQQSHTPAQWADFLAAVARLGSVAAAAKELGINRSTCQKWANAAGIRPQRSYTQAGKIDFYAVLDRTRSIIEAASLLGLNISTAQNWANKANPDVKPARANRTVDSGPAPRHQAAVIEEFLGVLNEVGSVSVAAKQLGLNRSTCSNWANEAGVASISARRRSKKQLHYLQLRLNGASRRDSAMAVGASKESSYLWDRQQTAHNTTAVGSDAAALPYKQGVKTTTDETTAPEAMAIVVAARGPAPAAANLAALEQPINAWYLSLTEREQIADLQN